jgi:hypothetical protein
MKDILDYRYARDGRRRLAADNLKRCPVCGAVNAKQNDECFVCSWHGEFETHPEAVAEGLELLIVRCPELADVLMRDPTLWERFKDFCGNVVHTVFHRNIDTYV